ncbi:RelA/SpoT family protein [Allofustis seminis]|uniref:RelA/SpoT family protein n=1 Tax=Allofustis seminis TaxID=166939 RepID=UPI000380E958|nr:bifunctional (p)ppGpp synthetase/guanosine-3',5'-bis(diphosphate) 3'-pyrophosphohydrolase [Allofustis seminis]
MSREKVYTAEEVFDICKEYMNDDHIRFVERAYALAKKAHKGQMRKSGEEYITHPVQVAAILAELHMDPATIATGFLHDVVEDTEYTHEDIERLFSAEVADLVEGVTKLGTFKFKSKQENQAENHRKMLLAMAQDVRVVLVKLADRLHNIRTIKYHRPEKQKEIARETLEIYAPLADRLGISRMKWELEDTSFRYLNSEKYYEIVRLMASRREDREKYINKVIEVIQTAIDELGIEADIYGRPKHIYSIYRKMVDKNKEFNEIYDLLGIRVLVHSIKDCYAVLGAIHTEWKPMPGRFKDYIAMPKVNMYQSLHTTVLGPNATPLEVQIRTYQMHEVAEYGVAAHWAYKEGKSADHQTDMSRQLSWFRDIIEFQKESDNAGEFMEAIKEDIFTDKVYVFTPNGEVMELPEGASTLDFAYHIHSEIGNKSTGARVNGRIVPLNYKLKTGDIVEIITSNASQGPSRDWLNFVNTSKARNKIRRFFKIQHRDENIEEGKTLIKHLLLDQGFKPKDILTDDNIQNAVESTSYKNQDDLFAAVGFGEAKPLTIINRLTADIRREREKEIEKAKIEEAVLEVEKKKQPEKVKIRHEDGIVVEGASNLLIRISKCCNPVPGDDIVGYITRGRGISIHRRNCPNVRQGTSNYNRLIEVEWENMNAPKNYMTDLEVTGYDRNGLLNDVLQVISSMTSSLKHIQAKVSQEHMAIINFTVAVSNTKELQELMKKINQIPDVYNVKRVVN